MAAAVLALLAAVTVGQTSTTSAQLTSRIAAAPAGVPLPGGG
jgi:hypothetical protein